jgi:NAD(P)-dependent dehydrogenase (short-subunit alcohol dehydrogenase family)
MSEPGRASTGVSVLEQFRMRGQVALVTGAGSGLGAAFAAALAEAGADVACVDLDRAAAELTAQAVRREGQRAIAVGADVSREADAIRMVRETAEQLGGLHIAFANAGIAGQSQPLTESSLAAWQQVVDVNLTGVFLTAREAARVMITTASIYGFVANFRPGRGRAYAATKAAVVNLTRSLAIELAPHNIQVNAIAPTFIRTNVAGGMLRGETEESRRYLAEIAERTPIGRIGTPDELKGLAVFLASPASSLMTGTTVAIDGGYLAW